MINKYFSSIETTSLNDRFFQSFAKVRVSSILATLPDDLPQGTIKEVHKAAGFEENGLSCVCYKHY